MTSNGAPQHLLAVEDVPANLALLHAVLEPAGFQVHDAMTLQEARSLLHAQRPALILLDVRLPDGDGLDLAREMQHRDAPERVPILAISASVLPHERDDALAAGCDAFLPKPLRPAELLTTVRGLLNKTTA
ncbi:MAG: response regulator [Armatimonadetes bacterium]|nr:response regulator [Armatimonadota bacterium]